MGMALKMVETYCQTMLSKVVSIYAPDSCEGRSDNGLYPCEHFTFLIIFL